MVRLLIFSAAILLSTPALAQPAIRDVPSPGTIEDPTIPIKLVADGPPRLLNGATPIRMNVSDNQPQVAMAASAAPQQAPLSAPR